MIELNNLTKSYTGGQKKAVDNLSWKINDGEIAGFIGPNGAGKSTTIKMMTGLVSPDSGSVALNGFDITKDALRAKQQFAYVSDTPDNFLRLKVIEYLNFIADIYQVSEEDRNSRITDMAKRFDLMEVLERPIMEFSHGMRQKVMIMGALVHNPSIWILDEPMVGLDPNAAFTLKELMREHAAAGNSVLFSTHVLEVAEKLCDHIGLIVSGQMVFQGTMEELKGRYPKGTYLETIFMEITKNA
ncbi:MAG: ABC transporter ATP-binding protein [Lachnospiraceae bacterium]|nr:ABC transporter ATP-binding protein [Lachnospiraceae bacterium]